MMGLSLVKTHNFMATARVLVVGGGASGGGAGDISNAQTAGGGSGGQVQDIASHTITPQTYTVTVGAGGTIPSATANGNDGGSSIFDTITSVGGGGGCHSTSGAPAANSGAYGGGGHGYYNDAYALGSSGTVAYQGGNGNLGSPYHGGGGGGAGGNGQNGYLNYGVGGAGVSSDITGTAVTYGGGGGGNRASSGTAANGTDGGGSGGTWSSAGVDGAANRGGGGGGGGGTYNPGAGGSGFVCVRWTSSDFGTCSVTGTGNTIDTTTVAGQSIAKFIVSGTLTIVAAPIPPGAGLMMNLIRK